MRLRASSTNISVPVIAYLKTPSEFSTKKKQKVRDDWLPGGVGRNRTPYRVHASHALERFQSVSGTWCETERQKEFAVGTQSHGEHTDDDCNKICVFEEPAEARGSMSIVRLYHLISEISTSRPSSPSSSSSCSSSSQEADTSTFTASTSYPPSPHHGPAPWRQRRGCYTSGPNWSAGR